MERGGAEEEVQQAHQLSTAGGLQAELVLLRARKREGRGVRTREDEKRAA